MLLMIFRFFLQSCEYNFFIKRLKNVSSTKMNFNSFNQNKSAEKKKILEQANNFSFAKKQEETKKFSTPPRTRDFSEKSSDKKVLNPESQNRVKNIYNKLMKNDYEKSYTKSFENKGPNILLT